MGIRLSHYLKLRKLKVLVLGPDAAGKTTLLYHLKTGRAVTTIPTIGFNVEEIQIRRILYTLWDVGGQDKLRTLWKNYFIGVGILAFVVDSSDHERIVEAKEALESILMDPMMDNAILLVYANKQDIDGSMGAAEVMQNLGLTEMCRQPWFVQPSCAITGDGLYEGLRWASKQEKKLKKRLKKEGNQRKPLYVTEPNRPTVYDFL